MHIQETYGNKGPRALQGWAPHGQDPPAVPFQEPCAGSADSRVRGWAEQRARGRAQRPYRRPRPQRRAAHRGESQLLGDLTVVLVPLPHLGLPSRQVAADEAEARAVELKADAHGTLVPRLSAHARLHCVHCHVPGTENVHTWVAS